MFLRVIPFIRRADLMIERGCKVTAFRLIGKILCVYYVICVIKKPYSYIKTLIPQHFDLTLFISS